MTHCLYTFLAGVTRVLSIIVWNHWASQSSRSMCNQATHQMPNAVLGCPEHEPMAFHRRRSAQESFAHDGLGMPPRMRISRLCRTGVVTSLVNSRAWYLSTPRLPTSQKTTHASAPSFTSPSLLYPQTIASSSYLLFHHVVGTGSSSRH